MLPDRTQLCCQMSFELMLSPEFVVKQHLIQIQHTTERALSSAMAYSARGNEEIAEPWVRHCEETLAGVKKALAVDDATSPMDGSLVPASPGQLSRFKKLSD